MTFWLGQEVVCIKDVTWKKAFGKGNSGFGPLPKNGDVFVVANMGTHMNIEWLSFTCAPRVGFGAEYFRPVKTIETDISIFTAMLNPATHREAVS
jgi:hypothetical protein